MLGYVLAKKIKIIHILIFLLTLCVCSWMVQFLLAFLYLRDVENISQYPVILWWTPFMPETEKIITCSNDKYQCFLTKDRNHVNDSHLQAFLFYGTQIDITDIPVPKNKLWALFHEESPRNVPLFLNPHTYDHFEIVATFSQNSDLPLTLQYLENSSLLTSTQYVVNLSEKNKLLNDIASVLYIQSDCDTPIERDSYVRELMMHIRVDSFGKCVNNAQFPKELLSVYPLDLYNDKFLHFIAKYKFIIAFENAICRDYITEKLWRPLIVGSIPIYLGSPYIEDWLPNEKSAILAKNFKNPQQLAEFINKINNNDTLYTSYLEHKSGKITNDFLNQTMAKGPFGIDTDKEHPIPAFECFVCEQLNEGLRKRSGSVYDCAKPKEGNSWEYFWQKSDCQYKAMDESIKKSLKLAKDPC